MSETLQVQCVFSVYIASQFGGAVYQVSDSDVWPVAATLGTAVSRQPSKVMLF